MLRVGRLGRLAAVTARRNSFSAPAVGAFNKFQFSTQAATDDHRFIIKSKIEMPELNSDMVNTPLPKFVMANFNTPENRDLVGIVDGVKDKSLTFQEIYKRTYCFASAMRKMGLSLNERVSIISPNTLHYSVVFLGAALAGLQTTCINPLNSEYEILQQVNATNTKVIVAHPFNLHTAVTVAEKIPGCKVLVFDEHEEDAMNTDLSKATRLSAIIKSEKFADIDVDSFLPQASFDPDAILTIPFSSGTTGAMKGVMLTHRNLVSNLIQIAPFEGPFLRASATKPRGSLLCPLPFFHIYGLVAGLLCCHQHGAKLVFKAAFDLPKFLELVEKHKITRAFVVPPVVLALAKHPIVDKYDLSSLECLMSGAAPLGEEVQAACAERLDCLVKQAWGMTELSPCGSITHDHHMHKATSADQPGPRKGSSGVLPPGTEAKIVCPQTGENLPYLEEGELLIRGPQVMQGYLNNEEATRATIRPDGFMHTGDIARFDEHGFVYITDRKKELIKYKGYQVPPAELEALVLTMPQVKDVCVIPVPDDEAGELPRAYVVRQDEIVQAGDSVFSEEDVVRFVHERVAPHKRLRGGVVFVDSVPKSPSGKLLRRVQVEEDRARTQLLHQQTTSATAAKAAATTPLKDRT